MSYTKTNWTKGDVITAEKLNKIESGIEQASSGSGDKSRIEIRISFTDGNVDPLPVGLEFSDFIDSIMVIQNGETVVGCVPTTGISNNVAQGRITIFIPNVFSNSQEYVPPVLLDYYPATGEVLQRQS